MPPITSSRPGARLTRIGRDASNSADNSARTRFSSVGTGSNSSNRAAPAAAAAAAPSGLAASAGGLAGAEVGSGGLGIAPNGLLLLIPLLDLPRLQNHAVEKPTAGRQFEHRRQHVGLVEANVGIIQLKSIRPQRRVPPLVLLVERRQRTHPRP